MARTSRVAQLCCEYLLNPLGIDETKPRLSWILECERRGARQTAWQVKVSSSLVRLGKNEADLWDSGRVEGDRSTHVTYEGVPLQSRMTCHWKVTVWDETGMPITSEPACWTMGLLQTDDWKASWIAADPEIIR